MWATSVLVAPVIPGFSDTPDQLAEVVDACMEAGARSVTAIPLHLRPGVREHAPRTPHAGSDPSLPPRFRAALSAVRPGQVGSGADTWLRAGTGSLAADDLSGPPSPDRPAANPRRAA